MGHVFEYIDPVGELVEPPAPYRPRPFDATTAQIGVLSNCIVDATAFLGDVAAAVGALESGWTFRYVDKGGLRYSTFPFPHPGIVDLAQTCHGVVTGLGHCGSCTAGSIRDAVALAELGTSVVALVTEKFEEEAHFVARAAGISDIPMIILPHPISGRPTEYHQRIAHEIAPRVRDLLTVPVLSGVS